MDSRTQCVHILASVRRCRRRRGWSRKRSRRYTRCRWHLRLYWSQRQRALYVPHAQRTHCEICPNGVWRDRLCQNHWQQRYGNGMTPNARYYRMWRAARSSDVVNSRGNPPRRETVVRNITVADIRALDLQFSSFWKWSCNLTLNASFGVKWKPDCVCVCDSPNRH